MDQSISFEISEDGLNILVKGVKVLEISEVSDENVVNLFLRGNIFKSNPDFPDDPTWEIIVPRNGDTFCTTCGETNPEPEFVTVCQTCQSPVCASCNSICDNCGEVMCLNCCQVESSLPYCAYCPNCAKG